MLTLTHRYLAWMEVYLTNMEITHPGAKNLLTKGAIAVARSMIPGSLSAVDKTMKETFMRFAKSSGKLAHELHQKYKIMVIINCIQLH